VRVDDVANNIWQAPPSSLYASTSSLCVRPGAHRSPRHRMPFYSRSKGSKRVSMTWRALGLADIARYVIEGH